MTRQEGQGQGPAASDEAPKVRNDDRDLGIVAWDFAYGAPHLFVQLLASFCICVSECLLVFDSTPLSHDCEDVHADGWKDRRARAGAHAREW